jgi:hypothetical protein
MAPSARSKRARPFEMRQRAAVQLALSIDCRLRPELAGLDGAFLRSAVPSTEKVTAITGLRDKAHSI